MSCNICNNDKFINGPGNRLSITGKPPRCSKCGSLERHRIYYEILKKLYDNCWSDFKVLQFSKDITLLNFNFINIEFSIYGGRNSIDIQDIDRPDNMYDFIWCCHILEHVENDSAAIFELLRILKHGGLLFIAVPSPLDYELTNDWGFPDKRQHEHYRMYGKDFIKKLESLIGHCSEITGFIGVDEITGVQDILYVIKKPI